MTKQGKNRQTGCPVTYGLDAFGDRWSLLVIRDMMLHGKKTYGDFLDADEHISTNILADRLKHLEAEGIIDKLQDPKNRRSFIYTLTEKGLDLAPVILETIRWSGKHIKLNKERNALLHRIETDRDGLLADIASGSCREI
jgi:DNA-binding HxlR family transcriptional regulator